MAEVELTETPTESEPVADLSTPTATHEPMRAQNAAMEARLRELGVGVDTGRVAIADLRLVCQVASIAKLLTAKGIATEAELDVAYQTELHDFLAGVLVQVETQRQAQLAAAAKGPGIVTPDGSDQRTPGGLIVPMGANRAARRHPPKRHTHD